MAWFLEVIGGLQTVLKSFVCQNYTIIEKYMAQSLHIALYWPFTNLPFGICAVYFDLKVLESDTFPLVEPPPIWGNCWSLLGFLLQLFGYLDITKICSIQVSTHTHIMKSQHRSFRKKGNNETFGPSARSCHGWPTSMVTIICLKKLE